MNARVLIVDDEPLGRQRIADLCAREEDLEVVGACHDVAQAQAALERGGVDIVFLDIHMPSGSGFDVLAELPAERRPIIVFVTAHAKFAVRAFDEQAVDYLLKPYDSERFQEALRRARARLELRRQASLTDRISALVDRARPASPVKRLLVRSAGQINFIDLADVEWLDAAGNGVRAHTTEGVHRVRETISALESELDPRFARIHRSTIVNLDRVRQLLVGQYGEYVVVTDRGQRLTVGRRYRDRLHERLRGAEIAPTRPSD